MNSGTAIDRITAPLDHVRREVFRQSVKVPALRRALLRRDTRVTLLGGVHVFLALAVATCFPVFAFLFGPILFGVVHVAADVRYLVLRRSLATWFRYVIAVACVTLIGLRIYSLATRTSVREAEVLAVSIWAMTGVLAGRRNGVHRLSKRSLFSTALVLLGAAAWMYWPARAEVVLLHGHNLVALVAWLFLFARSRAPWLVLALVCIGSAALLGGLWAPPVSGLGARFYGLHVLQVSEWVAPGLDLSHALALTSVYVFLQSVHYAAWLYYIPQHELPGEAPATFHASAHGLVHDFGWWGITAVLSCVAAVLLSCLFWNLQVVRHTYLSLANFHVYLELVLLLHFWTANGAPIEEPRRNRAIPRNALQRAAVNP